MLSTQSLVNNNGSINQKYILIYNVDKDASSAVIKCKINGTICNTLLDSGAGCSLIDEDLLRKTANFSLLQTTNKLFDASGNPIPIVGTVNIPVSIIGTKFTKQVTFYVSNSKANLVILGRDFMKKFRTVTFNLNNN